MHKVIKEDKNAINRFYVNSKMHEKGNDVEWIELNIVDTVKN